MKDWARGDKQFYVEYTDVWNEDGKRYGVVKFENSSDYKDALTKLDNTKLDGEYVRVYEESDKGRQDAAKSRSRSRSPVRRRSSRSRSPVRGRASRSRSPPAKRANSASRSRSRSPRKEKSPEARRTSRSRSRSRSRNRSRSRS